MTKKVLSVKRILNPLSTNFTKWSNKLKQFVAKLPTNCLSVFDHFVKLALKGLTILIEIIRTVLVSGDFTRCKS